MDGGQKRVRWKGREFRIVKHKMAVEGRVIQVIMSLTL
jgi:hypothetical protein